MRLQDVEPESEGIEGEVRIADWKAMWAWYGDLLKKVGNLSDQVNDLSDQLQKFGRLYGTGRR